MRYLFAPIPVTGHVNPGLPIARELVCRGHDVRWYSTRFKRTIESIGARWVPLRKALPLDEENFDIGPDHPAEGIAQLRPPSWWGQVSNRRVVLVTQGTINNDFDQLIRPAIRALADLDVLIIVTTGSKNPEDVEIESLPSNVRVERFIPYAHLIPHVDVLLTNGGYGSIQIALAPEIANRVNWSGVGIGLKVRIPTEGEIRDAVKTVLHTPTYAARAEALRYELAGLDAAKIGADLLEELAGSYAVEEEALERSA